MVFQITPATGIRVIMPSKTIFCGLRGIGDNLLSSKKRRRILALHALMFAIGLHLVKLLVNASLRQQLLVRSMFNDSSVLKNQQQIGIADGRQTMCDHERGAAEHQAL